MLLSMMDGFSRGLPRVVLKGARMEPWGAHSFTTFSCFLGGLRWGCVCSAASVSHLHSSCLPLLPFPPLPPNIHNFQFTWVQKYFLSSPIRIKSNVSHVLALYYELWLPPPQEEGMVWGPELMKFHSLFLHFNMLIFLFRMLRFS